jgi:hypothetical protein
MAMELSGQVDMECWNFHDHPFSVTVIGAHRMRLGMRPAAAVLSFFLLASLCSSGGSSKKEKEKVVYVCACLQTKSCFCMTEAKMEGPCACGTQGGPPMKAVKPDSDWAKENREALAK